MRHSVCCCTDMKAYKLNARLMTAKSENWLSSSPIAMVSFFCFRCTDCNSVTAGSHGCWLDVELEQQPKNCFSNEYDDEEEEHTYAHCGRGGMHDIENSGNMLWNCYEQTLKRKCSHYVITSFLMSSLLFSHDASVTAEHAGSSEPVSSHTSHGTEDAGFPDVSAGTAAGLVLE